MYYNICLLNSIKKEKGTFKNDKNYLIIIQGKIKMRDSRPEYAKRYKISLKA